MKDSIQKNEELFMQVKNIILKYFPFVEDRLYILDDARKMPEMDIELEFCNNKTLIRFLVGTSTFKHSVVETVQTEYYIDFYEIKNVIDFILDDHEFIKYIEMSNDNKFELGFAINWTDKAIKGITCGDINLKIKFNNNIELRNQYIYLIFNNYLNYLEKTPSFIKIKNEYLDKIKLSYINSLNKTELMHFISQMSEAELRQLLSNMNNNLFTKYSINNQDDYTTKKLVLKKQ